MNPSMYETKHRCYAFEEYTFKDPLLDVDATYIIHLVGNGKYESILQQLQKFPVSKKVFLVLNQGYKTCKKNPSITKPPLDIVDAYLEVFAHAKDKGNILILEDDFLFDENILDPSHRTHVNQFLHKKKDEPCSYYLGLMPCILFPYDTYHYKSILTAGSHAVIYSKPLRERLWKEKEKIIDWDEYLKYHTVYPGYVYYTPLCYQLYPDTDNSKHWGDHNLICYVICTITKYIFKWTHLDTSTAAYPYYYAVSKVWVWVLLLILVFIFCKKFL